MPDTEGVQYGPKTEEEAKKEAEAEKEKYHYNQNIDASIEEIPPLNFKQFKQQCLDAHNKLRHKHGCRKLRLDEDLCAFAELWAVDLANRDTLEHRRDLRYGESLYKAKQGINGETPVLFWYNEIKDFDFTYKKNTPKTNNFSAIVWRDTRKMGVGIAETRKNVFVVVNYSPPGNVLLPSAVRENVPPPGTASPRGCQIM